MKLLVHSTFPAGGSSYSVLTARTVPALVRMGHNVTLSTWYGLQGAPQGWPIMDTTDKARVVGNVTIYPHAGSHPYGADTLLPVYKWVGADVCMPIMDLWVLPPDLLSRMCSCPWMPVDHDPCPQGILESARACAYPMVYSQWGTEVLRAAGVDAHYVPCSADPKTFYPVPKATAREKCGIPDDCTFLVSMVAANKDPGDRKGFGEALQGFARFHESHPGSYLYLHTFWGGPINIEHIINRLGLDGCVIAPNQMGYVHGLYSEDYMRYVYSASNVLLNPAKSEGFGLPIVEAQMCGCPVAITDFSTSRELLSAGWLIDGQRHWSMGADSWRLLANVDSIVDALTAAYDERDNELLGKQARKGALAYASDKVVKEYWQPAMADIERIACGGGKLQLVQF